MPLPPAGSPVWADIVSGKKQVNFEFLAARIFMGSATINVKKDPASTGKLADELHKLFAANEKLPSVQKDIAKM